jgi:DNA-binding transcriptional ArsR family regulator
VIRLRLNAEDLARIRLTSTPGPFAETVWAAQLIRRRSPSPVYSTWRRTLKGQLGESVRPLATLFPAELPGLDLATLVGRVDSVDEGIEAFLAVRQKYLQGEIEFLSWNHSLAAWPWTSLDTDLELRRQLGATIASFHAAAIGPRWPQVRSFLNAELARQIRRLATGGIDEFLASLCPPLIQWRPPILQIHASGPDWPEFDLAGRGLVIMPTVFHGPGASVSYDLANCDGPPALIYPAARDLTAAAELWTGARDADALAALLGRTRSAVLQEIAEGCGTVELALRVGISPAAASQHATVLRHAGLITTHRVGSAVLHSLTALGSALLDPDQDRRETECGCGRSGDAVQHLVAPCATCQLAGQMTSQLIPVRRRRSHVPRQEFADRSRSAPDIDLEAFRADQEAAFDHAASSR